MISLYFQKNTEGTHPEIERSFPKAVGSRPQIETQ